MEKLCEKFKGGFCEKIGATIPASFCKDVCKNEPEKIKEMIAIPEKRMPPLAKQALSFSKEALKYLKSGRPKRTDEQVEQLKAICIACPEYKFNGITPRCYKCGCCVNLATLWATKDCPLGKWPDWSKWNNKIEV